VTNLSLIDYLKNGKWAVVQTTSRRLFLIQKYDYSDCGGILSLIAPYADLDEFCEKGVYAWQAIPIINNEMSANCRKFTAAFELLKGYPKARQALCEFDNEDLQSPFNDIVIVALAIGKRNTNYFMKMKRRTRK